MALIEKFATVGLPSLAGRASLAGVPLAWRNILANKQRLIRSIAGIAFAVLLMMVELGFRERLSSRACWSNMRQLDGEIMLVSSTKYQFGREAPFLPSSALPGACGTWRCKRAAPVHPKKAAVWKNPQDPWSLVGVQVFAFDPDQPVFLFPGHCQARCAAAAGYGHGGSSRARDLRRSGRGHRNRAVTPRR